MTLDPNVLLTVGGAVLAASLPLLGATTLALRAKVRETIWKDLVIRKQAAASSFVDAMDNVALLMNLLHNVSLAAKTDPSEKRAYLSGVISVRWGGEMNDAVGQHFVTRVPQGGAAITSKVVQQLDSLAEDLYSHLYIELTRRVTALTVAMSRMYLIAYDGRRLRALQEFALETANRVGKVPPPDSTFDFEAFFAAWKSQARQVRIYLRLDMQQTGKSFWRANRISRKWKREILNELRGGPAGAVQQ